MNAFASLQIQPRHALILFAAACIPLILPAQEKPTPPETPAPAIAPNNPANPASFSYDVVSIKPYKPDNGRISMWGKFTPNGFIDQGDTLSTLIDKAYPILTTDQVEGLPQWGSQDYYNVEAKMDESTIAAFQKLSPLQQSDMRRSMMQQLLADRFKLKLHKVTRELPVYNLVVAKGGLKFKETTAGKQDSVLMGWGEISGDGIEFDNGLLMNLSSDSRRFVVNKTGLKGKYSLSLKWNPYASFDTPDAFVPTNFKSRPDIFIALEQQLGLKLESAKGPVDVYVIDHIEKPSEN